MEEDRNDDLAYARMILDTESRAIAAVRDRLDESFLRALDLIEACRGQVVVTGVGKSGLIAQKVSATLASTGTPSFWLHATEAFHGDLGRIRDRDLVLALSHSGETEDVVRLIPLLRRLGVPLVAITADPGSRLGREADIVLPLGRLDEACPMGLAPTSSTTATLALGDALALAASRRKDFTREEYALFHRGGALGRKLLTVGEIMRKGEMLPVVGPDVSVRRSLSRTPGPDGRLSGAVLVVDGDGRLLGIFTDGDLRRHVEEGTEFLEGPVSAVMTPNPKTVRTDMLVAEAQRLMQRHQIDEVPVLDAEDRPVGILDIQDLLEVGFAL